MGSRRAGWSAWVLCGLITCLGIVIFATDLLAQDDSEAGRQVAGDSLLALAIEVTFTAVAALILSRQPRNTIGWLLLAPAGAFLLGGPIETYLQRTAPAVAAPTPMLLLLAWLNSWGWLLLIIPLLHIPLLFPNGRPPSPRWRWASVATVIWAALFVLVVTLSRQINSNTTPEVLLDNPIGLLGSEMVEALIGGWIAGLLALIVLCVAALFVRFRRAGVTEREQIKWLLFACAVFLVVYVTGMASGLAGATTFAGDVWVVLVGLSLMGCPVAIGVAILRYRLYEIDLIINRTLVYATLTVTLVLTYLIGVVLLQGLFRALTGQESDLAIVASTLLIAALFQPLRTRIQAFIDRRFYRRKYDAARVLAAHAAALREEVDPNRLAGGMLGVVSEAVQPAHASVWLRPTGQDGRR